MLRVKICCKVYSTFSAKLSLIYKKLSSCDTIKNDCSCFCFLLLLQIVHDFSTSAVKEIDKRFLILESDLELLYCFTL